MTAGGSAVPSCWRRSGPGRKISRDTVLAMPPSSNVRLEIFGSGPLPSENPGSFEPLGASSESSFGALGASARFGILSSTEKSPA
jgi:hypothetical protein